MRLLQVTWQFVSNLKVFGYRGPRVAAAAAFALTFGAAAPLSAYAQELFHISLGNYYAKLVEPLPKGELLVAGDSSFQDNGITKNHIPFLLRLNAQGQVLWQQSLPDLANQQIKAILHIDGGFVILTISTSVTSSGKKKTAIWRTDVEGKALRLLFETESGGSWAYTKQLTLAAPDLLLFATDEELRALDLQGNTRWIRTLRPYVSGDLYTVLSDGTIGVLQGSRDPKVMLLNHETGYSMKELTLQTRRARPYGIHTSADGYSSNGLKLKEKGARLYGIYASTDRSAFEVVFEFQQMSASAHRSGSPGRIRQAASMLLSGTISDPWTIGEVGHGSRRIENQISETIGANTAAKLLHTKYGGQALVYDLRGKPLWSFPVLSAYPRNFANRAHHLSANKIAALGSTSNHGDGHHHQLPISTRFLRIYDLTAPIRDVPADCIVDLRDLGVLEAQLEAEFNIRVLRDVKATSSQITYQLGDHLPQAGSCGSPPLPAYQQFLTDLNVSLQSNNAPRFPQTVVLRIKPNSELFTQIIGTSYLQKEYAVGVGQVEPLVNFLSGALAPAVARIAETGWHFPGTEVRLGFHAARGTRPSASDEPPSVQHMADYSAAMEGLLHEYESLSVAKQAQTRTALEEYHALTLEEGMIGQLAIRNRTELFFSADQVGNVLPFVLNEAADKLMEQKTLARLQTLGFPVSVVGLNRAAERQALLLEVEAAFDELSPMRQRQILKLGLTLTVHQRGSRQPYGRDLFHAKIAHTHASRAMEYITNDVLHCYRNGSPLIPSRPKGISEHWLPIGGSHIRSTKSPSGTWQAEVKTGNVVRPVTGLISEGPLSYQYERVSNSLFVSGTQTSSQPGAWVIDISHASAKAAATALVESYNLEGPSANSGYLFEVANLSPSGDKIALRLRRFPIRHPQEDLKPYHPTLPKRLWIAVATQTGELVDDLKIRPQCDWWENESDSTRSGARITLEN